MSSAQLICLSVIQGHSALSVATVTAPLSLADPNPSTQRVQIADVAHRHDTAISGQHRCVLSMQKICDCVTFGKSWRLRLAGTCIAVFVHGGSCQNRRCSPDPHSAADNRRRRRVTGPTEPVKPFCPSAGMGRMRLFYTSRCREYTSTCGTRRCQYLRSERFDAMSNTEKAESPTLRALTCSC